MAHFFFGYSFTLPIFLLVLWLAKRNIMVSNLKEFIKKRAVAGIVGGIWAEIPDSDYLFESTVFHANKWSNIFFFHFSLDEVLLETDLFFAAEMFLIFAVVNLFALVASVKSFNRLKEALFGKKEDEEEEEDEEDEVDNEEEVREENENKEKTELEGDKKEMKEKTHEKNQEEKEEQ